MKFIHNGSYYRQNAIRKNWLNFKAYFMGIAFFMRCMIDYGETVIANELTIKEVWDLAHSLQDVKIGRICQIEW